MSVYSIFLSVMGIFIFVYFAFIVFERCFLNDEQLLGFHNPLYQSIGNSNKATDENSSNDTNYQSTAIEMKDLSDASQDPDQGK